MQGDWVGLATRAREGDLEAFAELIERFKGPLCAAIHQIVRDWHATQDVAQEAFAAAYRQMGELRDPHRFRAWLYRIARNRAVSRVRSDASFRTLSMETVKEEEVVSLPRGGECMLVNGAGGASGRAALDRVRRAILALPNDYGSLLCMRYVEELTVREIAEVLDRTPKAVKAVLYRARLLARDYLRKAGLDYERVMNEM